MPQITPAEPANAIILSLSVQWWTPEKLAPEIGKSVETIYRRARELRERNLLPGKRCIWCYDDAMKLANYVIEAGYRNKHDTTMTKP